MLASAADKLSRAGWDITAAVGNTGGKRARADTLNVDELKALLSARGWSLAKGTKPTQGSMLACAKAGCTAAVLTAAAADEGDLDVVETNRRCWGQAVADAAAAGAEAAAPAGDGDGVAGGQQQQQPAAAAAAAAATAAAAAGSGDEDAVGEVDAGMAEAGEESDAHRDDGHSEGDSELGELGELESDGDSALCSGMEDEDGHDHERGSGAQRMEESSSDDDVE